jgi:hypothetical protein
MSNKVTVTIVDVATNKELHKFTFDPTKTTYVIPEGSKLGLIFKPEEEQMTEQQNPYSFHFIPNPIMSEWHCYMFGNKPGGNGFTWRPHKGKEPNWFWRKMQYLILGNLWVKDDD